MVSVGKSIGIMAGIGAIGGAGASYFMQNKVDKIAIAHINSIAKDGTIPIGGMKKDGTMWDGQITVDEFKKNLSKKRTISSVIVGLTTALGTAVISGLTLLIRGKVK